MRRSPLRTAGRPQAAGRMVNAARLRLECAQRGLMADPTIRTALQQLSVNPSDAECARFVQGRIHAADVRDLLDPDPFRQTNPGCSDGVTGPIRLGQIGRSSGTWGIRPEMLTAHLCAVGRTGGGKTTVIKAILRHLLSRGAS